MTTRRDFRNELGPLYAPPARGVTVVDVPPLNFLMIDGAGDPNGSATYADAVAALFAVSYALKFTVKRGAPQIDYRVMPLEGLWWTERGGDPDLDDRSGWHWTMMVMQPEVITPELVQQAVADTARKKPLASLARLRFEPFAEGRAAQVLHLGPFSQEWPNIRRLHEFITARAEMRGKHHEIYLSDVSRADPSRWRTILRQPMS